MAYSAASETLVHIVPESNFLNLALLPLTLDEAGGDIYLKTPSGEYIVDIGTNGNAKIAIKPALENRRAFRKVEGEKGAYTFQINDKFMCAEPDGRVTVTRKVASIWERFRVNTVDDAGTAALAQARRLLSAARLEEAVLLLDATLRQGDVIADTRDEMLIELIKAHISRGDIDRALCLHDRMTARGRFDVGELILARLEREGKYTRADRLRRSRQTYDWQGLGRLCSIEYPYSKKLEICARSHSPDERRGVSLRRQFWPSHAGAVVDRARVIGSDWAVYSAESGGFLYSTFHHHLRVPPGVHPAGRLQIKAARPSRHIRGTAFLLGGYHNYYHHLIDYSLNYYYVWRMMQEHLSGAADLVRAAVEAPLICSELRYPWQLEVFELLGIPRSRLIPLGYGETVLVDRLILLPQMEIGYGWMRDPAPRDWLIERVRAGSTLSTTVDAVYISRKSARTRRIQNEQELENRLADLGIKTVVLEQLSVAEQLGTFLSAKTVIASHGAGLANIIVAPRGTAVVELMPADGIKPDYYLNLATSLGLKFLRFPISKKFEDMVDSTVCVSEFLHFLHEHVSRVRC